MNRQAAIIATQTVLIAFGFVAIVFAVVLWLMETFGLWGIPIIFAIFACASWVFCYYHYSRQDDNDP